MTQLKFKHGINELSVLNYQELSIKYSFDEINKMIINHLINDKLKKINLVFESIQLGNKLTINGIFRIIEIIHYLDICILGIKIYFKN